MSYSNKQTSPFITYSLKVGLSAFGGLLSHYEHDLAP
jgi:hypothetical protein